MGCVSSKILMKSGSFQESVSHSFQRTNNVIEEVILSSSKSNGDQFLALLCTSSSSARKAKEPEQSAAAELPGKIETINVSELLAGLEEENCAAEHEKEWQGGRNESDKSPAQCASHGDAAGRVRSFRTVEEFDALVTQSGPSEQATAPRPKQEAGPSTAAASTSSHGATGEVAESSSSKQEAVVGKGENAGAKRRSRARQLGELKVPTTFDFSKSGSLRDWLRHGGQIFSPGSYITPKFGTAPAVPAERGGGEKTGEKQNQQQQQQLAVFDPELVAQFERAMEQLSEDEERVLTEILEALELETGEEETAALGKVSDRPPVMAVAVRQD